MGARSKSETFLESLLEVISRRNKISLRALARKFGLSPPALRTRLRPLFERGLLASRDGGKSIAMNRDFGCVVGIDMGASRLRFALADFCGEILRDSMERIRPQDGPRKMIAQINQGIRALTKTAGHGRLRAVAMGVPSPVDAERGLVAFANNLPGWKDIRLGRELERAFRVPVYLENDANMAAIGEHWRGAARGVNNFVFVALGTGIGSGIFTDGKLYRGRSGSAGELFRMNLEWPRWNEDFGDLGYFESQVSGLGIASEGRRLLGAASPSDSAGLGEEREAHFVFKAFRRGDARARAILEKIFTMLGVALADLVAVLDPELIVLGGGVAKGAPDFLLTTVNTVVRRIHPGPPPVKLSSLEDKAQTYGAIYSALTVARQAIASRFR